MDNKLPLGILRQACMKMDSFITDIYEVLQDEDITEEDKYQFEQIAELSGVINATIVNIIHREMNEEDFLNERPDMDELIPYPTQSDILSMEL